MEEDVSAINERLKMLKLMMIIGWCTIFSIVVSASDDIISATAQSGVPVSFTFFVDETTNVTLSIITTNQSYMFYPTLTPPVYTPFLIEEHCAIEFPICGNISLHGNATDINRLFGDTGFFVSGLTQGEANVTLVLDGGEKTNTYSILVVPVQTTTPSVGDPLVITSIVMGSIGILLLLILSWVRK
jgi:hypothetical protein